ncbi:MAG: saccharopine dehydrogenase NADP-binding domain-containing protein [Acidimicrobiales bacterium]|nr:saccharopine dehydrogenase NADP-binding domain-containing protein [Acidimicrobiales bacterium]
MSGERRHDVVVFGATGFTGRLVCEHLRDRGPDCRWAIAGRNRSKLEAVHAELGLGDDVSIVVADSDDQASLDAMAADTRVLCTTAGPYQWYGSGVVAACATHGTDYVDLAGETPWMKDMIEAHHDTAVGSGARIVFAGGFDSVPSDLGVFLLQETAIERHGRPMPRVRMRVRSLRGSGSGGTMATMRATMRAAKEDPSVFTALVDPFSLAGDFQGPDQPSGQERIEEPDFGGWSGPFMMAAINTKVVHRSNFLLDHRYGTDFVYDEMILLGPDPSGESGDMGADPGLQPGEGPSRDEREAGHYDIVFRGEDDDGHVVEVEVAADLDPGYGSTSKIIGETALCLLETSGPGGCTTPVVAMGDELIDALREHAGVRIQVREGA